MGRTRTNTLIGIAKAQGVLSRGYQKVSTYILRSGDIEDVLEATAHALLVSNLASGKISPSLGDKEDPALRLEAEAQILGVVNVYTNLGGVLTAKRHVEKPELCAEIMKQWLVTFPDSLEPAPNLDEGVGPVGVQQRMSLGAQCILDLLTQVSRLEPERVQEMLGDPGSSVLAIPANNLEAFCKKAARAVYDAFSDPERVIHLRAHGGIVAHYDQELRDTLTAETTGHFDAYDQGYPDSLRRCACCGRWADSEEFEDHVKRCEHAHQSMLARHGVRGTSNDDD